MSSPYIGEIRMGGWNFAPQGWATCDGQIIAISQNDALFSLIGTTYGGDGVNTFALPNLAARVPIHQGTGSASPYTLGETGGAPSVTLALNQIPAHTHPAIGDANAGTLTAPAGNYWANSNADQYLPFGTNNTAMNSNCLSAQGGGQAHDNMLPYVAITFVISLYGIYPSSN